ncbi:D-aminopeptidase, partial [Thioclava sp. BHET1]
VGSEMCIRYRHGATAEQEFRKSDALPLIAKMKTGHFAPGTAYSYCNCNFRIVSEIIESETGRDLAALYAERIFAPAGMTTALLHPDTRAPLDGVVGYEGNPTVGYLPAQNGIYWKGDAGIWASLDDMLAWECHIDAGRDDPQGLYSRISGAPQYRDGSPASYAYGLRHDEIAGVKTTGHGGALRGFRAHRLHAASERLSVVVMFNHEAMASEATSFLLHAALGQEKPATKAPDAAWDGQWLDKDQGLLVQLKTDPTGASLRYATGPSRLTAAEDGSPEGDGITLSRDGDLLRMERRHENLSVSAEALPALDWADPAPLAGRYHSAELEADLEIETRDGGSYVRFTGTLGTGPAEQIYPAGADVWIITSRRSMDAAPPGDWTVQIRRDAAGAVSGLGLGCWLARNIAYDRIG